MEANGKSLILQRTLGAVVLIAAAATLVPLVLDGQGMNVAREQVQVPEEPTFELELNAKQEPQVRLLQTKGAVNRAEQNSQAAASGEELAEQPFEGDRISMQTETGAPAIVQDDLADPEATPAETATGPVNIVDGAAPKAAAALPSEPTAAGQQNMEDVIQKIAQNLPVTPKSYVADEPTSTTTQPASLGGEVADAWTIQMGAFKDRANAQKVVSQLVSRGYRAYLGTHTPGVYRVFVGPEIRRERADQLRDRVATDTGTRGVVVRYLP